MATHPPQAPRRRSQVPAPSQGPIHNMQVRETSRSPALHDRPRQMKAQSMPMLPSTAQIFAANGAVVSQGQPQSSPTLPNTAIPARMLPIPPDQQLSHQSPQNSYDGNTERRSSSPGPQYVAAQNNVNTHFPRPMARQVGPTSTFPKYTPGMEMEDIHQMTEVLADIAQLPPNPYPAAYGQPQGRRSETPSPPKDPNVERIRAMERASPNNPDVQQRRQREQARESPKSRDRQPTSPGLPAFGQLSSGVPTPERMSSPAHHMSSIGTDQQHLYTREYNSRDSPGVPRRPTNTISTDPRPTLSFATQTPPLQSITARTPDRSLPVQEEPEDEFAPSKNHWQGTEQSVLDPHRLPSPAVSPDIKPEGSQQRYDQSLGGRDSRAGRRGNDSSPRQNNEASGRYSDKDGEGSGSYTPRSPSTSLPPDVPRTLEKFYQPQPQRLTPKGSIRVKTRNGSTDGLGLRTLDPSAFEANSSTTLVSSSPHREPAGYPDQRHMQDNQHLHSPPPQVQHHQQQQQQHYYQHIQQQQQQQQRHQQMQPQQIRQHYSQEPQPQVNNLKNGYYPQPQVYPDDFQNYSEDPASFSYLHAYLASPRPDAPIPPTPHSQTAASSPSPYPHNYNQKSMPGYSPIAPVGSPYPYPFAHVRRNMNPLNPVGVSQYSSSYDPNHPAAIQEQLAKQWQIYLQNQVNGNITDSTFSPAATPFQDVNYNPFSFLHTARLNPLQRRETMSMHSSPSHEPVSLPPAPMVRKREKAKDLRRQIAPRKPPPRVESTQPRDTSPEPSSSGEETAGEDKYTVHSTGLGVPSTADTATETASENPVNESEVSVKADDSNPEDWVDEDDDADETDLLEFELHPNYIVNSEKRRRRWEVGWEALVQAFQNLDRQTDTAMVVLAAPTHSSKLYSIRSRSIRRSAALRNSTALGEIRSSFKRLAVQRKNMRPTKPQSIAEKLLEIQHGTSGDGSDGSNESREEDLRRGLEMALGSLNMLNGMYEMRETRWQEEMRRMQEDKEKMALVLRQVLGDFMPPGMANGALPKLR